MVLMVDIYLFTALLGFKRHDGGGSSILAGAKEVFIDIDGRFAPGEYGSVHVTIN